MTQPNNQHAGTARDEADWQWLARRLRPGLARAPLTLAQAEALYRLAESLPLPGGLLESVAAAVLSQRIRHVQLEAGSASDMGSCLTDTWCWPATHAICTHLVYEPSDSLPDPPAARPRKGKRSGHLPASPAAGPLPLDARDQRLVYNIWSRCGELDCESLRALAGGPGCWDVFFDGADWPWEPQVAAMETDDGIGEVR